MMYLHDYGYCNPCLDAPENIVLSPAGGSYVQAGDVLSCSAEANPSPSFYEWRDSEGDVIDFGDDLVVPEECEGIDELCVTCFALNEMRDDIIGQGSISACYNSTGMN